MADNAIVKQEQQAVMVREETIPMNAIEVGRRLIDIQDIMKNIMAEGIDRDYAKVPGCGNKPALLKPGAEKLMVAFRLAPKYEITRIDLPGGHREYEVNTLMYSASGVYLGGGVGTASTMESKWRYRTGEVVFTGKPVPQEYWTDRNQDLLGGKGFSAKKNDNGKWEIVRQGAKTEHPDPADYYNTCLKMAKKRSLIDATLSTTGASDLLTQDIEENPALYGGRPEPKSPAVDPQTGQYIAEKETLGNIIDKAQEAEFTEEPPDWIKDNPPEETKPITIDGDEDKRIKLHAILESRIGEGLPYPKLSDASKKELRLMTTYKDYKPIDRLDWLKKARLRTVYGKVKDKYPALKEDDVFPMPEKKQEKHFTDDMELPF